MATTSVSSESSDAPMSSDLSGSDLGAELSSPSFQEKEEERLRKLKHASDKIENGEWETVPNATRGTTATSVVWGSFHLVREVGTEKDSGFCSMPKLW